MRPLLGAGSWVLLDRFVDSSLAYQGAGARARGRRVRELNLFATGGLVPTARCCCALDPAAGRARLAGAARRPTASRRGRRLLRADRRGLRGPGADEPERIRVIDAGGAEPEVLAAALAALRTCWSSGGRARSSRGPRAARAGPGCAAVCPCSRAWSSPRRTPCTRSTPISDWSWTRSRWQSPSTGCTTTRPACSTTGCRGAAARRSCWMRLPPKVLRWRWSPNTQRALTDRALNSIGHHYFSATVCGDGGIDAANLRPMLISGRPRLLGLQPDECLAIEDSVTGTAAAEGAGCPVLVVPNDVAVPSRAAETAHLVAGRGRPLSDLGRVFAELSSGVSGTHRLTRA